MAKKLYKSTVPHVVRGSDGIIAETRNALILSEDRSADRIFFPIDDVAMVLFDESDTEASDAVLGQTSFFHLAGMSSRVEDVAWSFEFADGEFEALKGHLTFDPEKVAVEAL